MAEITLHNDRDTSATYVPNRFIDNFMTAANGEYVKIYLYLLRCMNSSDCSFSLSGAADKLEHTEKDIQRALKYWEKMKLLHLEYDKDKKLSGICFLGLEEGCAGEPSSTCRPLAPTSLSASEKNVKAASPSAPKEAKEPKDDDAKKRKPYSAAQLAAFQEKSEISELLFVTEHYLKRPLTPTDMDTILFWYDGLKFSVDLIEYLIEYCIGKGHTSLRYMDKVAMGWQSEGITRVDEAKRTLSAFSQLHFSVMRALGISGRNLVASEVSYINKWSGQLGFTQDIIAEACRRTMASVHQPSFEYTDSILMRWHKLEVHSLNDIARLDSQFQKTRTTAALQNKGAATNRFNNFSQRTYDYDKLEEQLLGQR